MAIISNIHKNIMGTISFTALFNGMRKAQDFIVYAIREADQVEITIQSKTRIGRIVIQTGEVKLSAPKAGGAYFHHLNGITPADTLSANDLTDIKEAIRKTSDKNACNNSAAVYVDNGQAHSI